MALTERQIEKRHRESNHKKYWANPEKSRKTVRLQMRQWRADHLDEYRAYQAAYHRRWYRKNKEDVYYWNVDWQKRHPEKVNDYQRKYKWQESIGMKLTQEQWTILKAKLKRTKLPYNRMPEKYGELREYVLARSQKQSQ